MKTFMRARFRARGITLVETTLAATLLSAVVLMTCAALQSSFFAAESTIVQSGLESSAAAAMDLMARELKDSGTQYSNFSISTNQQSITFARCVGFAAKKPVFGNPITYSVVTYGTTTCLERTEVVDGAEQKQIITDQLLSSPTNVVAAGGGTVTVTGANFQILSAGVVTITLALARNNYLLNQNKTTADDRTIVTSQTCIQLTNS